MTIGKLSNKVLLKIFRYDLDVSPRSWPRLVHVCRRWRRIVFGARSALNLRLFCTNGTPVSRTLDCWPVLPIVLLYGGSPALDPPAPEDEADIMVALQQSHRVSSVSLTVTNSLRTKFSKIKKRFRELEDLVLLSQDDVQLTLPNTFRWGACLRRLHLTRITFPSLTLVQRLSVCRDLVDIQLHEISSMENFPPGVFANALSWTPQLQSLSLHFLSTADYIAFTPPLPLGELVLLPALSRLKFQGIARYLEGLVAGINAPGLKDIEITFSDDFKCDTPKLLEFINRIEMQKLHRRADIRSFRGAISLFLTQPEVPTCLKLQVFCKKLRSQPFYMARICSHFSAFLCRVDDLRISLEDELINATWPSSRQNNSHPEHWLGVIRQFGGAKQLHVAGYRSTNFARILTLSDGRRVSETVLPTLQKLIIREPEPRYVPSRVTVVPSVHPSWFNSRIIAAEYEGPWIREPCSRIGTAHVLCYHPR